MVEEPVIWTTPFAGYHIEAIVQESLWNAWRHGGIGHVTVLVKQENDHWQIEIVDDGVGFNPAVRKEGHHGLSIMRERARSIGGKLQVLSKTSQGTKVRLLIPRDERGTTARSARGIRGRRFPW
jgi:two-component system nitrate/nitrite sensor histidine kinase NarX